MVKGDFRGGVQKGVNLRFAAAVLFRQVSAVIAQIQTGGADAVPLVHDVADKGGEHGDGGKVQEKTVHRDAALQGHSDQEQVGCAVPQEDNQEIG